MGRYFKRYNKVIKDSVWQKKVLIEIIIFMEYGNLKLQIVEVLLYFMLTK